MSSLTDGKKTWTTKLSSAGLVYLHFGRRVISTITGERKRERERGKREGGREGGREGKRKERNGGKRKRGWEMR